MTIETVIHSVPKVAPNFSTLTVNRRLVTWLCGYSHEQSKVFSVE